jgi:hypothetical protein
MLTGRPAHYLRRCLAALLVVLLVSTRIPALKQDGEQLIRARTLLGSDEVAEVLRASRLSIAEHPFRLVAGAFMNGPEFVFDAKGELQFARTWDPEPVLTEYAGTPALMCNGSIRAGQLVLEFRQIGRRPTIAVRASVDREQPFAYAVRALLDSERAFIDKGLSSTSERALSAHWVPPGLVYQQSNSETLAGTQTLWINTDSLFPDRLELDLPMLSKVSQNHESRITYRFQFDDSIELRAPDIAVPNCIR